MFEVVISLNKLLMFTEMLLQFLKTAPANSDKADQGWAYPMVQS